MSCPSIHNNRSRESQELEQEREGNKTPLECTNNDMDVDSLLTEEPMSIEENEVGGENIGSADQQHAMQSEEVVLTTDANGRVCAKADQVQDYVYRPNSLRGMNLWQYISRTFKEKMRTGRKRSMDGDLEATHEYTELELEHALNSSQSCLSAFRLREDHPEHDTHCVRMLRPWEASIPVPIGPMLPRSDRDKTRERFARVMLLLFKPWTDVRTLREEGESCLCI